MDVFRKCTDYRESKMVKASGLYPFFHRIEESCGSTVVCDGKKLVMTGSNNYLGLTHDPRVKEAAIEAIMRFGTSCTGSRFLNGNLAIHEELEKRLAAFVGKQASLVFTTGFLTNLGAIGCITNDGELILSDADNHASIAAGCMIAKGRTVIYKHNDPADCAIKMKENANGAGAVIITDGVFSMSGTIADLPGLVKVKGDRPGTRIYIDDAHGLGVIGRQGRGTADHFGLTEEVDLIMGTFSKSFASIGGFVAAEEEVIEFIRHKARSFMFSASMPAAAAATILKCLDIIESEPERFERLKRNVEKMLGGFRQMGLKTLPSETPIISIFIGEELKTLKLAMELFEKGVFATPAVYPAVPYGQALIRTSYMATHTDEDLDFVLNVFSDLAPKYGLARSA